MNSPIDIKIKLISDQDEIDGYETSNCKLNFTGKTINTVIINTLRRIILTLIPTYAFNSENINITKNSSIFNNDYMRLRFSNLPIYITKELNDKYIKKKKLDKLNIINMDETLEKSKELEYRANLGSAEVDITIDNLLIKQDISDNLTINVNVKNLSENDIMNVMSNNPNVKYFYAKEQISHIYSQPILLIQLQPLQEFSCTMISNLNIGMYNATYSPCSSCHFEEDDNDEHNFMFTISSRRQISEKDIIIRTCKILDQKLINVETIFENSIGKKKDNKTDDHLYNGTIVILGEQHTLGNLVSRYLQEHPDITFAGYKVGHPNVSQVEIKYHSKKDILIIIKEVIEHTRNIFKTIREQIEKMKDFGYKYI